MLRDIPEVSGRTLEEDERHIMRLYFRLQEDETFKGSKKKILEAVAENSLAEQQICGWPVRGKSAIQGLDPEVTV